MINIKPFLRLSSRKFYDLVQEQNLQIIPQVPEDAVLSKYISFKQLPQSNQARITTWQKQNPTNLDYSALLSGSPYGSIQNFNHRNHELTLISTNYFRTDEKKLHKVLYHAKPDAIVIQRRPEYHLHNFNMFPKGADGIFSDRRYLDELKFSSAMLQQTPQTYRPMVDAVNKSRDDVLEKNPSKEILQQKGFQVCTNYSSSYQTPMFFGEIPLRSYRQWIANTHTLMELQQIFKVVCQRLPRYKHISFTPYQMATLIYPDIFLKMNDNYMATIIQMLISTKYYKKIVGIFGIVQNQAVKHILQKDQALKPVIEFLIPPGPQGSIVRDIQQLQIVEKQILLDVMFFGPEVQNIKSRFFHTTNAVIERYAKEMDRKVIMQFRYDKTMQYLGMMQKKIKQGEEEIKKQFVRETLREKKN